MNLLPTYTTRELGALLDVSQQAILKRAARESWQSRPRKGRGGGNEWFVSSMPAAVRDTLASALLRHARAAVPASAARPTPSPVPAVSSAPDTAASLARASDRERRVALARLAIVREVERLAGIVGKAGAVRHLLNAATEGTLPPVLADHVNTANACRRRATSAPARLSRRSVYRWCANYAEGGEAALVPGYRKPAAAPSWAEDFLRHYAKPQHPSVVLAYKDFCRDYAERGLSDVPSIHAVRRLLAKMAAPEREAGRATGNALLKLRPYKRRDTGELWPTDVYTADGTTFDAEILHPYNGQPFKPELTAVLDVATRRCVGLSINLSESALTILDALRMACCYAGVPALFYSDGGPGYINNILLNDRTGIFQRLGIEPTQSIPGRPQGKGLMERAVKTLWVEAAQSLPSYTGALMDGDAAHRHFKLSRAALKAGKRGALPDWEHFKAHILRRVEAYNATPHRGLPRFTDSGGRRRHYSPNEYWKCFVERGFVPVRVPEHIREELFMPGEQRQVRNGWIQFYNGRYYADELAEFHGDYVEVRYDIWDSGKVWIWTLRGEKVCTAVLDGNTIPYFPPSRIEAARERRARAQVERLDAKLQRVVPGARIALPDADPPALADSTQPRPTVAVESAAPAEPAPAVVVRPALFMNTYERYRWLMAHPDHRTDADAAWLAEYSAGEEYAELEDLYAAQGILFRCAAQPPHVAL